MEEFIIKYWIEVLFGGFIGVAGFLFKSFSQKIKENAKKQEAVSEGVVALLHDRLYAICNEKILSGGITTSELKNLTHIYEAYKELGGNGTGKALYEKCLELKIIDD